MPSCNFGTRKMALVYRNNPLKSVRVNEVTGSKTLFLIVRTVRQSAANCQLS